MPRCAACHGSGINPQSATWNCCTVCDGTGEVSCPSPSLHYSPSDDALNTKILTLADCGYCEGKVVVR